MTYRSKKLLNSARNQPCAYCGRDDGTTVAAHANGVSMGKGIGHKAPDCLTAHLCAEHHDFVDGRAGKATDSERRAVWNMAFARTVVRWFETGVVK